MKQCENCKKNVLGNPKVCPYYVVDPKDENGDNAKCECSYVDSEIG